MMGVLVAAEPVGLGTGVADGTGCVDSLAEGGAAVLPLEQAFEKATTQASNSNPEKILDKSTHLNCFFK